MTCWQQKMGGARPLGYQTLLGEAATPFDADAAQGLRH